MFVFAQLSGLPLANMLALFVSGGVHGSCFGSTGWDPRSNQSGVWLV